MEVHSSSNDSGHERESDRLSGSSPLSRWTRRFWRQLRETANPTTMHTEDLTPAELEKQASFDSFDYHKPYPYVYMAYLRERYQDQEECGLPDVAAAPVGFLPVGSARHGGTLPYDDDDDKHIALRWFLHVLIAVFVGVVATIVSYGVEILEVYRAETLTRVIGAMPFRVVGYLVGYCFWVLMGVVLVAVAAGVVVYGEPAAAGGGIPDVMAYLNGVHVRRAMNIKTFVTKAISCICAVAGGLPVGIEAPLIHLGAIVGAGVSQGRSRSLGFQTSLFQAFRNNKDRRDFITAGAACGVSAAFGAPIGGLLFVMEEVSSFWDHSTSGHIFLATMIAFVVTTMINSVVEEGKLLGWVTNAASVLFEVNLTIPLNLVSIVPSFFLGAILGGMAAFFTKVNLILVKWRRQVLRPYPLRRFLEPIAIVVVYSTCMYTLTLFSDCRSLKKISDINGTIHVWGTEDESRLFNDTCRSPHTYSPFGTLNMATGKNTIRHLFSRQTVGEFPIYYLVPNFVLYFLFVVLSSGTAISGGLVVPSLVVGALFGRLYGLCLWTVAAERMPEVDRGYAVADAWLDPGVFALIGAGAFLAGTSRMTISICVIMVELSSELHYLLPVMVAIAMSKTVADWLSEPLYHQMLHFDSVPYLSAGIMPRFEELTAADVMASPVVTLHTRERTEVVLRALRETTHNAFPVVREENEGPTSKDRPHLKFEGLVTREDLQVYFTLPQLTSYHSDSFASTEDVGSSDGFGGRLAPGVQAINQLKWSEWSEHKTSLFLSTTDRHAWIQSHIPSGAVVTAAVGGQSPPSGVNANSVRTDVVVPVRALPSVVDLSLITNRSPWVIPPYFNLQMTYHAFRSMGLRHMVVLDGDTVCGIITRKDLLVDSLRRRTKELHRRLTTQQQSGVSSLMPSYTSRIAHAPTAPPSSSSRFANSGPRPAPQSLEDFFRAPLA